jgi:thymidylate kinase
VTDPELLGRLSGSERAVNGIPDEETMRRRERAAAAAEAALADVTQPDGIRTSPLGAGWSSDVDVHVTREPEAGRLEGLGWIRMDGLLSAIGSPGRGRWAIVERGEVLGTADLHGSPPPDPLGAILERCRRRREVRIREVLELRELARRGVALPKHEVTAAAADAEAALGGDLLSGRRSGRPRRAPVKLRGALARRAAKRLLRRRGARVGLALSGVDGSGKSTVGRLVLRDLERLGVPASTVWTRPGLRIAWLEPIARSAKRVMREDAEPGVLRVAADPDRTLRSRRGPLGWTWATLVTASFVRDVRRRSMAAHGVIVYDRHLLDALVTLSFAYRGVDLRAHRRLVRRRMPPAAASFYLEAPAELAVARKPGDAIGEAAVRRQLERYAAELETMPDVVVLDASRPAEELARRVLAGLLGAGDGPLTGAARLNGEAPATPRRR